MVKSSPKGSEEGRYDKTTLRNGLRVVSEQLPWARSVSVGVWVDVGSRNEKPEENGLSHFIEHMVFKGTTTRSSNDIALSLESLGGSLNAFTSRENTCYTARCLDKNLPEAVDVLADMTCRATFTPANIRKEQLVVCEEIKESHDTPSDKIHDNFAGTYWGKHPLGQPILGDQHNVLSLTRSRLKDYIRRHYRTQSIVVSASGAISHRKLVKLVREKFDFPEGLAQECVEPIQRSDRIINIERNDAKQTHLCFGFPGIEYAHPGKMVALVLQSYLGGGMSSVLFQKVREQKGLAYTVYAYNDFYRDCGIFGTYVGTDGKSVSKAFDIIRKECRRVKKHKIPKARLEEVKTQLSGSLMLSLESTFNRMTRLGRQEIALGEIIDTARLLKMIRKVSQSDVMEMANQIMDESRMAAAVLGPVKKNVLGDV